MLNRFLATTLTLFTVGSLTAHRAEAQNASQICYFNKRSESCTVTYLPDHLLVTWLSDGKTVIYSFHDCRSLENRSADSCWVTIEEDNGNLSTGFSLQGGRGAVIWSNNGNVTNIPPPDFHP